MNNATDEQKEAILKRGKNTIVSAGAGSGKTFVLKLRVLEEITKETTVDKLIILTFTNAAAGEMKERIRKVISENESAANQAELVDSAYITTFDSYAQSLVKKYNYLLNISKNFTIIDENIVNTELTKILEDILNDYYKNPTNEFISFIKDFAYKNDNELKKSIIEMYRSLTNLYDKDEYLDKYINNYYNEEFKTELINEYDNLIYGKINHLLSMYDELLDYTLDDKAIDKINEKKEMLEESSSRNEYLEALAIKLPSQNKNNPVYDECADNLRKTISSTQTLLKDLCKYTNEELLKQHEYTKNNVIMFIKILKELDKRISNFKREHNAYEFSDIAIKAVELVKNNEDVRNEIKNNTYEIMIDEYQDTNDIQEKFISYISNNNVYMVGDVKQSIYRFRNANPYIFKEKYDNYKDGIKGYKIDLTNNFRSRSEVLKNINDLFSKIMFDEVGGAKYKEEHKMNPGNKHYNENKINEYNYNMSILNYEMPESKYFDQVEIEAFTIAKDIQNKMNSNMKVMDGDNNFNDIKYSDFCILVDKSTNFESIKKILEYFSIPTIIQKEISVKEDDEVFILKNLITLLTHIKNNLYDESFRHAYMSIARSYAYKINDNNLFDIAINNKYKESDLFNKLVTIANSIDGLSNKEILSKLISEFDMFNKLTIVGDVDIRSSKLEYFINEADNLNKFGLDIYSLESYFDEILSSDDDLKMGGKVDVENAVRIMTIHKSKGLEFPFVYMPFMQSHFTGKKRSKYPLTTKYGIILPYNENNILDDTFISTLYNESENIETISEKIRLLYVAVTRAREQFIIINSWNESVIPKNDITPNDLLTCKSFKDILTLLKNFLAPYTTNIDINSLGLTKDYNLIKDSNYDELIENTNKEITTKDLKLEFKVLDNKHFSKSLSKVIDKEFKERLDFGTYMHYVFEVYDFQNNNIEDLDIDDIAKEKITNFLKHNEVKDIKNSITYKEHEIKFNKDGSTYHGFIDLLVEYPDHFDIIDYKLSNINSEEYKVQLTGYKEYIEERFNKPTNIYLYSINKDVFKKL